MASGDSLRKRTWFRKFRDSFSGVVRGVHGQSSFVVHLLITALVVAVATWLAVSPQEWCLLVLSIAFVLVAEMFNSGLEMLAKAVDARPNPFVGAALDIASGAVLLAALGASVVGAIILLPRLIALVTG